MVSAGGFPWYFEYREEFLLNVHGIDEHDRQAEIGEASVAESSSSELEIMNCKVVTKFWQNPSKYDVKRYVLKSTNSLFSLE